MGFRLFLKQWSDFKLSPGTRGNDANKHGLELRMDGWTDGQTDSHADACVILELEQNLSSAIFKFIFSEQFTQG